MKIAHCHTYPVTNVSACSDSAVFVSCNTPECCKLLVWLLSCTIIFKLLHTIHRAYPTFTSVTLPLAGHNIYMLRILLSPFSEVIAAAAADSTTADNVEYGHKFSPSTTVSNSVHSWLLYPKKDWCCLFDTILAWHCIVKWSKLHTIISQMAVSCSWYWHIIVYIHARCQMPI